MTIGAQGPRMLHDGSVGRDGDAQSRGVERLDILESGLSEDRGRPGRRLRRWAPLALVAVPAMVLVVKREPATRSPSAGQPSTATTSSASAQRTSAPVTSGLPVVA